MARLIVRHHGQEIADLMLEDGREYLAGRAEDASIQLPAQKGISRHHLKFYQQNGVWVVELLARFGSLLRAGQTGEVLELTEDCNFSAPPFEFAFSLDFPVAEPPAPAVEEQAARMPTVRTSVPVEEPDLKVASEAPDEGNNDATKVGIPTQLVPYVRIIDKSSGKEEILKLEGQLWVAGRESNCEIPLETGRASRRHFEISRTKEGFFITDLDSANGTLLNDEALTGNQPWQLASGDVIKVSSTKIIFEIRDANFGQKMPALVPQPMMNPIDPRQPMQGDYLPMPYMGGDGGISPYLPPGGGAVIVEERKGFDFKKHRVRIAIGAVVIALMYGLAEDKKPVVAPDSAENSSTTPTFEALTPEKKQAIKNSFNLAMNMYMQTRYELCIAEIKKLHEMVPSYENSKELLTYCEHGSELLRKKEDADRREREQAESERAIMQVVEDCRAQLQPRSTIDNVRICLAPAIERSPEHPAITELLQKMQAKEEERQLKLQNAESARQRRNAGLRMFEKAKELYKSGELAKALNEYEKFINGGYDDLDDQRGQAQRDVAQVRKELGSKVASLVQTCRENLEKSQYKAAHQACEKALREDANNSDAKNLKGQILADMKRELKSMYEDSVLEESMGNIDTAKERWKQILDKSIPGDEYYNKAKRNLQKYGAG
ncbi:MAG: FHA domain-containing protein [Bdellovibrionales bacterium]